MHADSISSCVLPNPPQQPVDNWTLLQTLEKSRPYCVPAQTYVPGSFHFGLCFFFRHIIMCDANTEHLETFLKRSAKLTVDGCVGFAGKLLCCRSTLTTSIFSESFMDYKLGNGHCYPCHCPTPPNNTYCHHCNTSNLHGKLSNRNKKLEHRKTLFRLSQSLPHLVNTPRLHYG